MYHYPHPRFFIDYEANLSSVQKRDVADDNKNFLLSLAPTKNKNSDKKDNENKNSGKNENFKPHHFYY